MLNANRLESQIIVFGSMETKEPKSIAKVTIRANIYYYYIMILFKQFYWLLCCHLTFRKIWYCLIKTRIELVSLSFSNEIYKKNHVHFNVIKQLQSFVSVKIVFKIHKNSYWPHQKSIIVYYYYYYYCFYCYYYYFIVIIIIVITLFSVIFQYTGNQLYNCVFLLCFIILALTYTFCIFI